MSQNDLRRTWTELRSMIPMRTICITEGQRRHRDRQQALIEHMDRLVGMHRPPVRVSRQGVSSVRAADIIRSDVGQEELRKARDAKLVDVEIPPSGALQPHFTIIADDSVPRGEVRIYHHTGKYAGKITNLDDL